MKWRVHRGEVEQEGGQRTASPGGRGMCEGRRLAPVGSSHPAGRAWRRGPWDLAQVSSRPLQSALLLSPFQHDNSSLLNNYVLGAQLGHEHVDNLTEPINISFWHNQSLVLWGRPHFHPVLPL